jgi:nucleotide-binding universal stress UspA family protein
MIKNILLAIDYSEASLNALETSIAIAQTNAAVLQIIYINDAVFGTEETNNLKNARQITYAMADNIIKRHGVQTKVILTEGYIGPTIVKNAAAINAELIVMGTHGASGHRDLFIGSNSYFVIKHAACPVLIIPEGKKWTGFNKVLFPVRPALGALHKYRFINALIKNKSNSGMLEIFGISLDSKQQDVNLITEMTRELNDKTNGAALNFSVSFSYGKNVAEEVLEKADKMNADLIVISSTVDVANKQFFIGPFSQRIINHAKIPVLTAFRIADN